MPSYLLFNYTLFKEYSQYSGNQIIVSSGLDDLTPKASKGVSLQSLYIDGKLLFTKLKPVSY